MADAQLQQLEQCVANGKVEEGLTIVKKIKVARLTGSSNALIVSDAQYVQALECAVLLSIAARDLDQLNRQMAQLLPLYATVKSKRETHMRGLYLMALLVSNSSSEFHSELEQVKTIDKYLEFPISIERKLMVGIYDQILNSTASPDPSFDYFMEIMKHTVREAICDNLEVTYEKLTFAQAAELVGEPVQELREYIETERDDWIIENNDTITFQPNTDTMIMELPADTLIQQTLMYSTEIEQII